MYESNHIYCPNCNSTNIISERDKSGWGYFVTCKECLEFSFWSANDMMGGAFYNFTLISSGEDVKKYLENDTK